MELVSTMEINGEEREIADAYARGQIDWVNSNLDGLGYGKNGAYNLINPTLQTTTLYGITCTNNGDGTYTLNGTCTATNHVIFNFTDYFSVNKDTCIRFVCLPKGVGIEKQLWCDIMSHYTRPNLDDYGNGNTNIIYSNQNDGSIEEYMARIVIAKGVTVDKLVVKPMLVNIDEYPEYANVTYDDFKPYIPSVKMLAEEVNQQKNDLSKQCKKDDITTNETLIGTFNGKNYYRKLFTGISGSGGSVTVNVGGKIEIYNYYGRAYTYGQSGASNAKYPIPNKNYYIESQNSSETSFQLTIPTSSDTRKIDLVIEYTKVDE